MDKGGSGSPKKVDFPDGANSATSRDSDPKIKSNQGGSDNTQNSTNASQKIHRNPHKIADKIDAVVNKTIIQNLHLDSKNIFAIVLSFGFVVMGLLSIFEYIRSKNFYQPVVNNPEVKTPQQSQQDKAQEVYLRAKDKLLKKNVNGGIQDLTMVIQLNPKYTAAYIDRGLARRQLKDHGGAIQDFTTAISLDPNNFDAYNNRCGEYRLIAQKTAQDRSDKLNKGKKDCDSAISISKNKVANPFFNRAVIFAMLGESKKAISDFEYAKQISLGIQNDSDLYNLAENEINKVKLAEKEKYEPVMPAPYDPPDNPPYPANY